MLKDVIRSRKNKWIGHVLRGNGLLKEVIEGRIEGKRPRGRKRAMMLDDMQDDVKDEMKEEIMSQGKIGGLKCSEPAGRQKTNDDDDDELSILLPST